MSGRSGGGRPGGPPSGPPGDSPGRSRRRLAERLLRLLLPPEDRDRVLSELEEFYAIKRERGEAGGLWYWRQVAVLALRARSLGGRRAGSRRAGSGGAGRGAVGGGVAAGGGDGAVSASPIRGGGSRASTGSLLLDLKATLRGIRRRPGLATAAVLILALTIGVNTAVYSVADGILLGPLPYEGTDGLVEVWQEEPDAAAGASRRASLNAYLEWRERSRTLERVGLWATARATLTGEGDPRDVLLVDVSPGLLSSLGLRPVVGRGLAEGDDADAAPVLVLSHAVWMSVFGGDSSVVGRSVRLGGTLYEVVGVAEPGFRLPLDREVFGWTQFVPEPWQSAIADYPIYGLAGWLRPGVGAEAARDELETLAPDPAEARLESLEVRVAHMDDLHRPDDGGVLALLAAVTLVLLLGCLNTAQLLVARGVARGPDLAVRAALGSGRAALGRMLLLEAGLLVIVGTLAGLLIAVVLLRVFVAADPGHLPGWADVRITPRVAVYLTGVSIVASLVAGWLPARFAWRTAPAAALAAAKGATTGRRRVRMQRLLLAGQSAAAVVLLVGCMLLVRSWLAVRAADPGLDADDVYAARIVLPSDRYPPGDGAAHVRFFDALRRGVEARPGIAGASVSTGIPVADGLDFDQRVRAADRPASAGAMIASRLVGPGYVSTLGARLVAGRPLEERDDAEVEPVVVLNEAAGRQLFGAGPGAIVGRRVVESSPSGDREYRVVGVVADVRNDGLDRPPPPKIYFPWLQSRPFGRMWLVVRSERGADFAFEQIRTALREIDPELPLVDATPLAELLDRSVAARRFNLLLLTALAALAMAVAAVGVAGLVAFAVSRGRREIGVRVALGANAGSVIRTTTAPTLLAFGAGAGLGLLASILLARLARALLFGVEPLDGWSMLLACTGLLAAGAIAAVVPALRAVRADPVEALRVG